MSNPNDTAPAWNIESARGLYNIQRWGAKYFDINDAGQAEHAQPVRQSELTRAARRAGAECRPEQFGPGPKSHAGHVTESDLDGATSEGVS